jgi:hypothetical protein
LHYSVETRQFWDIQRWMGEDRAPVRRFLKEIFFATDTERCA